MQKISKKSLIIIGLIVIAIVATIQFSDLLSFFSLENLRNHREYLQRFVVDHYLLSVLIYFLVCITVVATTLPLSAFMIISAGFLFGMKWGLLYSITGATLGALISFIWLRYVFSRAVPENLKLRLVSFNQNIEKYGAFYFLSLHLMSILPFFLINVLAVIANLSFLTFAWTTLIGIIPISILYTYMGQRLGTISSVQEILTWPIILTFLALAFLAILPILISKIKKPKKAAHGECSTKS
jgi:uncharacterized membrane protein YdjX (TVP38/TMEM64 family)